MFIHQILLAQQSIPGVTPLEPSTPAPGEGLFDQVWGAATNSTEDLEIPSSLNKLWPSATARTRNCAQWQKEIQDWKDRTANYTENHCNTDTLDVIKYKPKHFIFNCI
jgi:hypothetical protein